MKVISKEKWRDTPKDFKHVVNNQKYIIERGIKGGAFMRPVIVKTSNKKLNPEAVRRLRKGEPVHFDFRGERMSMVRGTDKTLNLFYKSEKNMEDFVNSIGEHELLSKTNTDFLQVRKDKNKPVIKKSLKPQTTVKPHKRSGTRGVRSHTRRYKK